MPEILKVEKLPKADGLLIDLGFSSEQLNPLVGGGRGFSFMKDEVLDMRYNAEQIWNEYGTNAETAAEVVNSFNEKDLADIFGNTGKKDSAGKLPKNYGRKKKKRILTTFDLVEIIKKSVPKSYERGRIHPATRVFQALRIYINNELENLETILKNLDKIFKAIWSSGDYFVSFTGRSAGKNYFRQMVKEGKAEILTKKPITANEEEIKNNPRSRSAKLRAIKII